MKSILNLEVSMLKFIWLSLFLFLFSCGDLNAMTPIEQHGQLSVVGSNIVDQYGQPVALKGVSSHGLHWFGNKITKEMLIDQRDNWKSKVFRPAMYTAQGGYIDNRSVKNKMIEIIEWTKELGLYVIVDWHILHDSNPQWHQKEAVEFFKEIASRYASSQHIIYEICNEPNGHISWGGNIKPYATEVIKAIRSYDRQNVIIVGSGSWSQNIHDAANDPLQFANIAYSLHFYSGTHGQWLRDRIDYARGKGIAIFVTEWGTTNSTGNGQLYLAESDIWLKFLAERNIGWANWSYSNASESTAILNWKNELTQSGKYVKAKVQE
jgi:endoglucanase